MTHSNLTVNAVVDKSAEICQAQDTHDGGTEGHPLIYPMDAQWALIEATQSLSDGNKWGSLGLMGDMLTRSDGNLSFNNVDSDDGFYSFVVALVIENNELFLDAIIAKVPGYVELTEARLAKHGMPN